MVLIRNAEIHLPVLIDPAVDRAISVPFPDVTRYRVFPVWVEYGALDRKIQANTRTNPRHHAAYKSDVEGHLVIETLLDAFGFFLRCDPSLARRTVDGELEHFPLPEIAQHEYERRHPEWPTRAEYDVQLRAELASQPPSGAERTILHRFLDPAEGSEVYVGSTRAEHGVRWAFTESAEQIARDLGFGFAYKIGAASLSIRADNTIMVGEDILNDVALPVPSVDATDGGVDRSEKSWRALHRLATEDASFYARQRRGS
jgi:hypothetical protein